MGAAARMAGALRRFRRNLRNWASCVCIPAGTVVIVMGLHGLGGLLVPRRGILAPLVVDPVRVLLDLGNPGRGGQGDERRGGG